MKDNRGTPSARFDEVFKRHAVALIEEGGRKVTEVARELGVSTFSLNTWKNKYGRATGVAPAAPASAAELAAENARLRAENARLRQREEVLKKTLGILSEVPPSGTLGSGR
jgi:transposase